VRKNGTSYWGSGVLTSIYGKADKHEGFSKIVRDITEQKSLHELALHSSTHDFLTGLPNKRFFEENLIYSIQDTKKKYLLALLYLDFNNFKTINDDKGHKIGDFVLIEIAARLTKNTRKSDMAARLGGDEFVILTKGFKGKKDIENFAKKIVKIFRTPLKIEKKMVNVSVSVGLAVYPLDGKTPKALLHRADEALYAAKKSGGNQYKFYENNGKRKV